MIRNLIFIVLFIVFASVPAHADVWQTAKQMRADIEIFKSQHKSKYGFKESQQTLSTAFEAGSVNWAQRYTEPWGGWVYVKWSETNSNYDTLNRKISAWEATVRSGQYTPEAVDVILRQGQRALRVLNQDVENWFQDEIENSVERGLFLDKVHAISLQSDWRTCCFALRDYYQNKADMAFADSIMPSRQERESRFEILPSPPGTGEELPDIRLLAIQRVNSSALAAIEANNPNAIRRALRDTQSLLRTYPDAGTDELMQFLTLLDDRFRYGQNPVSDLLELAANTGPGPLRDAVLLEAQDGLYDRLGHLAPLIAASSESDADQTSAVTNLLDLAKRLVMLRDDIKDPVAFPSGALRAISGLKAAADILDLANNKREPRAKELMILINDIGGSTGRKTISPVSPIAIPSAIAVGQLQTVRIAWRDVTTALQGVGDTTRGDQSSFARSQAAAKRVKQTLRPETFLRSMTYGFIEGISANLPFVRSLWKWASE